MALIENLLVKVFNEGYVKFEGGQLVFKDGLIDVGSIGSGGSGSTNTVVIAYASDSAVKGFTLNSNDTLNYIAFKVVPQELVGTLTAASFAGLWFNRQGIPGVNSGTNGVDGVNGEPGGLRYALTLLFHGKGESVVEAYYTAKAGETEKSKEKLERAGDLFEATSGTSNSDDMKGYLLEKAVESYQNAYNLDSTNINLRMKYAGSLIEQGASPMQGIAMLLDIVKKDPDNADAQLMLGKFAMMSGQFEKAVQRLEKVISLRPQSNDALFLLAMAYENKGDKGKALEILQKCESREKNPELKKEIGSYIERLKKS